ncbi:MAG TPA: DUF2784 family protein [Gemmatales bacterium]|nr:DUF2784 family protein [Gemmatales bacterium]HMP59200.1 DUF2784 family protein [Gemmatales bacterium]
MNWPNFFANVILAVHVGYIIVVLAGLLVILLGGLLRWQWVRNFWFRLIHFAMMGVVVLETAMGWTCPLTTWEVQLRNESGIAETVVVTYVEDGQQKQGVLLKPPPTDFIPRMLSRLLFLDFPTYVFTIAYYTIGALILAGLIFVPPRWPWRRAQPAPG